MQRLSAPRNLVPGEVSLSYQQAEDEPKDAEGRSQIGITFAVGQMYKSRDENGFAPFHLRDTMQRRRTTQATQVCSQHRC